MCLTPIKDIVDLLPPDPSPELAMSRSSCLFLVVGILLSTIIPSPGQGIPKIRFESTTYDFGATDRVQRVTGKFTYRSLAAWRS
jgi:hypothetical protein